MFGYVSFRSLMAVILSLLISAIFGEYFINLLKRKQITETQRDASIDPFNVKKVGVPTMGGIIIIVAILIPCLLLGKLDNIYMILMLITTVWLGTLGFLDDYIKVFRKDKEGLHGKFKIIGQVGIQVFYGDEALSLPLAQAIQQTMLEVLSPEKKRAPQHIASSVYLMNHISCRAVLVECGFLSNAEEDRLLQEPAYQMKLAITMAACYLSSGSSQEGESFV